jgi:hypothetical protein
MFAKSKVSQSMIDAVNKVLGEEPVQQVQNTQPVEHEQKETMLNETAAIKEPTKTGMKVYGGSYGNSAKAKQDQTKNDIDKLAGPKDKEMKEELKGNQDKIDANNNNKIDAQDFKILKSKKKVKEGREFTEKLLETVRKSDVPAYLRKAKGDTPLTVADVKAPKKDSISAPENLAKARNEEVELDEEDIQLDELSKDTLKSYAGKAAMDNFKTKYDLKKSQSDWDNSIIKKRITKRPEASAAHQAKAAKRTAGVGKALRKADGLPTRPQDLIDLGKIMNREEYELDEDGPGRKWRQGSPLLKSRAVDSNMHDAEAKHPDEKRTWVARGYDGEQKEPVQRAGRNKEDPLASRANIKSASKGTAKTNRTLKQTIKSTLNKEDVSEYELDEALNEVLSKDASAGDWIHDFVHSDNPKFAGKSKAERKKMALGAYYGAQKEGYEPSDAPITTDTLAGRMPGGKSNSFKSFKTRVRPLEKEGEHKPGDDTPKVIQPQDTPARKSHEVKEATIAGTPGWEPMKKDVKDKSGATHTPMSRAKDLARQAFKTVSDKTKVKESK